MPEASPAVIVFLIGVGGFTLAAAVSDLRSRKIPNKMTLPMFLAGLVYQIAFGGWSGLAEGHYAAAGLKSALLAFALGFGTLFILWMVGGGGGGDVKLMGALSVWLGFRLTFMVMIASTVFVLMGTLAVLLWSMVSRGPWATKRKYLVESEKPKTKRGKVAGETLEQRQQRRIMAYAVPVALATWAIVLWRLPQL